MSMDSWAEENRLTNEWLQNLKEGDEVGISDRHSINFSKVTRTTVTQIHVGHSKFNRRGDLIGAGKWDTVSLVRPTEELKTQVRSRRIRQSVLNRFVDLTRKPQEFTTEQLQAAIAILEPKKVEECQPS
jgi:hypothetical protein